MAETFQEWEQRQEERRKVEAERFAAMSEVHRANMLAAIELMRELPATIQGLVAALGYMPTIRVGADGIVIVPNDGRAQGT